MDDGSALDIAIVGMAAHVPGAGSIAEFWANLCAGKCSIARLTEQQLLDAGDEAERLRHPNYVPAAATLDDFDMFDADFFGLSPKDAAIMDPQHRQFLEVAWEAMENAGHPPSSINGPVGVFAGCGTASYFNLNICSNPDLVKDTGMFLLRHTGNDKDFLATRASHIFGLTGPSINLQTACSTSLVATHYACQALQNAECDMALAGGVTIELPHGRGYVFKEGEILSPDGQCHAFDHRAQGTVFGSGAGVVVLRRLSDAIKDGDHIWAVIKGSAVNNDGGNKAGYLAPGIEGQAKAVLAAQASAEIAAETIDYVECHGTGTSLGDPIEVAALTEAFRRKTQKSSFCKIGSVKANIGHLDTAAGAAGLIKTALSLHHRQIPPSIGYEAPNPAIDFKPSPFSVNTSLCDWPDGSGPRRAAVNSLGVGGTNAHVILQEAPQRSPSEPSDWPFHILTLSARNDVALDEQAKNLASHLRAHPDQPLADVSYTLKEGRTAFEKRRVLVADTGLQAAQMLEAGQGERVFSHKALGGDADVVFMFPGGGAQYVSMGRDLYYTEPTFRMWADRGFDLLQRKADLDVKALWLADKETDPQGAAQIDRPSVQLPLIMIMEYALAQLWLSWGVTPTVLVGHSMGENTAACLAGVMSFEDCIGLVLKRGQLFETLPKGGMLSIALPAQEVRELLKHANFSEIDVAGINAKQLTVVSGCVESLAEFARDLDDRDVSYQRVAIDVPAHSRMLEPILEAFEAHARTITLSPPRIDIISNRSGEILEAAQATDPAYWVEHLRGTVHFARCLDQLAVPHGRVFLEMGPGRALASFVRMNPSLSRQPALSVLRHPDDEIADDRYFLETLAQLWALGIDVDWSQIWGDARRHRVPLPSYAFQKSRFFIEPGKVVQIAPDAQFLARTDDINDWGWQVHYRRATADCEFDPEVDLHLAERQEWLLFANRGGISQEIAERLRSAGQAVTQVYGGDRFAQTDDDTYVIAQEEGLKSYERLMSDLAARGRFPTRIVHLWLCNADPAHRPGSSRFHQNVELGFYSQLFLGQAIAGASHDHEIHITTLTNGVLAVKKDVILEPEKTTVLGAVRVIPRELPHVTSSLLDLSVTKEQQNDPDWCRATALRVLEDLLAPPSNAIVALRGEARYCESLRRCPLAESEPTANTSTEVRKNGTYVVTGGFGGIGHVIAKELLRQGAGHIVLLSRTGMPEPEAWSDYLSQALPHDRVARRIQCIQSLQSLSGSVTALKVDVTSPIQMRRAMETVRSEFGAIHGVVHAAGTIDDGPLLTKTPRGIEDVIAAKVHGTRILGEIFPDGELDWLVLCSSTSTAIAPAGQVDYVAANSYLNAYAQSRSADKTRVIALNWGIWRDAGMVADAMSSTDGDLPAERALPVSGPLVQVARELGDGQLYFYAKLDTNDWILDEHRTISGTSVLPGTAYLELLAQSVAILGDAHTYQIQNLMFLVPMVVGDSETVEIRIRLVPRGGGYDAIVESAVQSDDGKGWKMHAKGHVSQKQGAMPALIPVDEILARCTSGGTGDLQPMAPPQAAHMAFGPRWQVIENVALGDLEGIATMTLTEQGKKDVAQGYRLHPGLMDVATGWAIDLVEGYDGRNLWVPGSYDCIDVVDNLPETVVSWTRLTNNGGQDAKTASFDVVLATPEGRTCVEIKGLTLHKIEQDIEFATASLSDEIALTFDPDPAKAVAAPNEDKILRHNYELGIRPSEGATAFLRVLASDQPIIYVSSLDLTALRRQSDEQAASQKSSGVKFDRPATGAEFVAPSNTAERKLAALWQDFLGVEEIGVEDDFFNLGGHSLIAVRLFAQVKKEFNVEFPISTLFQAPTIRQFAALLTPQLPGDAGQKDVAPASVTPPNEQGFRYLVEMQDGEGGPGAPFFIVAGMFGNVLNLRHLAHRLGDHRRVYGLQARGLFAEDVPHEDVTEAARDYIAEIRAVQPKGPYFVGGFSGGGIIAYEIARQLEADGDQVALLALLDTPLPRRHALKWQDRLAIQWQRMRSKGLKYPIVWLRDRIAWEMSRRGGPAALPATSGGFEGAALGAAHLRAVEAYEMCERAGVATLFRPAFAPQWYGFGGRLINSERAYLLHDNGWGDWVEKVDVIEVSGDHDTMVLEPNVRLMALELSDRMASIETALRTSAGKKGGSMRMAAQ